MFDIAQFKASMIKALEHMEQEFSGLQVWRATTGLVDHISVDAGYGRMPINQVANVVVMDTTTLKIEPWDKAIVKNIETAIYDADNGLVPQWMGDNILVRIPPLTKERREEIAKQVSWLWEEIKVRLRQVRHDAREAVEKLVDSKDLSEDEQKMHQSHIDDLTKEMNTKVEEHVKNKQNDVLNS